MNMIPALIQAIRSLSLLDAVLVFYIALGVFLLLDGANMLLRRRRVSQRALASRRKTLSEDALLANETLDDETLARIIRHENAVGGVGLLGFGLGALVGGLCGWLFHMQVPSHLPIETRLVFDSVTLGLAFAGLFLGSASGRAINGFIWRKPAGISLPPALLRMSFYRPLWVAILGYVIVVACMVAVVLTVSGVVPGGGGFSQQQTLGLAILFPTLITILVLGPELALWLLLHHPAWPTELPQALALKLAVSNVLDSTKNWPSSYSFSFAVFIVCMGMSETPFMSFSLGFGLALLGIVWMLAFMALMMRQALRSKTTQATFERALALSLALDNQELQ